MNRREACSSSQTISKKTLLAMLPSEINSEKVIVSETGQILDVTDQTQKTIAANFRSEIWLPIEDRSPRKLLLYNENNWEITSFDSETGIVCVTYTAPSGNRRLSFTIS